MAARRFIVSAAFLMLLSACASIPDSAPRYERLPPAPDNLVNVYLYRVGANPTKRTPTIYIDEREVFDPPERAYTVLNLSPGKHSVATRWLWDTGAPNLSFPIDIPVGESYYLKLSGDFKTSGGYWKTTSVVFHVDEKIAEQELKNCCRYLPSKY